ncbi:3-deoxy-D-manno-oct-2-ulosonic acid (Kdo) hydroxylase [Nitrosomonas communis]|uniref:3-deoxy-D-manno-oct-2-ulosonic acid (Kdo) hydroxylase n=1 Tax=Nitrosomonas communis TaxID=44574 RepID=A0A1H2X9U5_9PROT|nr:3-deoxy-D-manno-oct-2-ulosonic acid (Kdo) hydroxylase [Nitrosomonas communis]
MRAQVKDTAHPDLEVIMSHGIFNWIKLDRSYRFGTAWRDRRQHNLDQTFYLPADAMNDPSCSPLHILER